MNYQKIYFKIIDRNFCKVSGDYIEKHHIIPKCLGGSNLTENIVSLTAREHFICHWLLTKIYSENRKIAFAFYSMCHQKRGCQKRYFPQSRIYETAKRKVHLLGHSDETRYKISKMNSGKRLSDEARKKISDSLRGKTRIPFSDEHKRRLSFSGMRRHHSDETKRKMSESKKGNQNARKKYENNIAGGQR